MKCYDCLYKPHCSYWDSKDFEPDERLCFSDRSEWMKLPHKPIASCAMLQLRRNTRHNQTTGQM